MHTLTDQAAAVVRGEVSPVELTRAAVEAAEQAQDRLNAFTVLLGESAMDQARRLEGAEPAGPLHGVPVAVKDLYDIAGIATTGCCAAYLDRIASQDSPVVAKLREAGAIIIGKTNMHELAFGTTTQVSCFGGCRNPWDTERIPGGSSGGSGAAVAAGIVTMAMGSDTGGSVRIPSTLCGVTGLKPTHGAVSLRGALPMTASFDTGGPLAVSAEDCALVHQVVAGFDPDYIYSTRPPAKRPSQDAPRIALMASWLTDAADEIAAALRNAAKVFESLTYAVTEIDGVDTASARNEVLPLLTGEFAHHFRDLWDDDRLSPPIKTLLDLGRAMTAADYTAGREATLRIRRAFEAQFEHADVLLAPGTPYVAPKIPDVDNLTQAGRAAMFTLPANIAGLPAVAFPIGSSSEGLPMGAQLIGRPWSELDLCSVVDAYQRTTDWHLRRPMSRAAT